MSVYVAWVPMLVTIFLACAKQREDKEDRSPTVHDWILYAGILLLGLPAFVSAYPQASWQWLTQVVLLAFFAWSLKRLQISGHDLLTWFVWSMVPHALLAIWQYATQFVAGTKWLGIATQDPASLGVSVVEVNGRRILRAYGGMPHPNLMGGWLAFGIVATTQLRHKKLFMAHCSLFIVALILTFSRSAWLAALAGLVAVFVVSRKQIPKYLPLVIMLVAGCTAFVVRDVMLVRASPEARLEQKSVSERSASMSAAWSLVPREWWLGQGQNTAIYVMDKAGKGMVPPHFIPLLILLETGIVGSLGVLLLLWRWIRTVGAGAFVPIAVAAPLIVFDHYLWSLWAGQALLMWLALLPLTKPRT